ncbi:hypothetical protein NPIL_251301 [Nephila pilipes]|uniref:Uncharacterized protein n=1 Tax=Nephila pilipes TaxID=299642 RepID=A0A8X6QSS8_NEPPI|nr:hypothetical protein NPIL_251301 [Nephila pilipes]
MTSHPLVRENELLELGSSTFLVYSRRNSKGRWFGWKAALRPVPEASAAAGAGFRGRGSSGSPRVRVRRGAGQPVLRDRRRGRGHESLLQWHCLPTQRESLGPGYLQMRGIRRRTLLPVHLIGEVHERARSTPRNRLLGMLSLTTTLTTDDDNDDNGDALTMCMKPIGVSSRRATEVL